VPLRAGATGVSVGHTIVAAILALLDRPADEISAVEARAISALTAAQHGRRKQRKATR
jgi:hypothetical protein